MDHLIIEKYNNNLILYLEADSTHIQIGCKRVNIQGSNFSTNEILIDDCESITNNSKQKKIVIRSGTKSHQIVEDLYNKLKKDDLILTMQPI